jgi:hypothetical protein
MISGSASFGSKTNVYELKSDGTKISLDGGIRCSSYSLPRSNRSNWNVYSYPTTSLSGGRCDNTGGCASSSSSKRAEVFGTQVLGGNPQVTTAPKTYVKIVENGTVSVQ